MNKATRYPQRPCLHHLFEAQVEVTPDRAAVVFEDESLTYQELNARANQLARYLRDLGLQPETPVGLCAERSIETVVELLGILKAGGAYLPLDPAWPMARIMLLLKEAGAQMLLAGNGLSEGLTGSGVRVISIASDGHRVGRESTDNAATAIADTSLAYIIFTSGSTGQPKGVAVEHRQVINYVSGICERLELRPGMSYAVVSTIAADLGNTAIFPSLAAGGSLHIISKDRATNPAAFADYFRRNKIDCLKITPSHLRALLAHEERRSILPRKRLIIGGETLSWDLIESIQSLAPDCQIYNHYGPTETTVGVLACRVDGAVNAQASSTVPLGRPLANSRVYILDGDLKPVPPVTQGELYIGGAGLARGYINQPEKTAERFISHSIGDNADERLYKTGDLARSLPDGNIEFLGRIDDQVKIRGYRIELGEVEAAIRKHPSVAEAVVTVREDVQGDKRLIGYLVAKRRSVESISGLRGFLRKSLPDYMIPSAFVIIDAVPLTENGKLARNSLPPPEQKAAEPESTYVTPRDPVERQVAKIFEKVLSARNVGARDNFFDLGGDSLLALSVSIEIERIFGQTITLATLFQSPTVEQLSLVLQQEETAAYPSWVMSIRKDGSRPPLFNVYVDRVEDLDSLAHHLGDDYPVYGLMALGLEGAGPLPTRVEDIAARYVEEMRIVQPEGPYYLLGGCLGGIVAYEVTQQLIAQSQRVALLAILDSGPPRALPSSPVDEDPKNPSRKTLSHYIRRSVHHFCRGQLAHVVRAEARYIRESTLEKFRIFSSSLFASPRERRLRLLKDTNKKAFMKYFAPVYPGRIVLIRSSEFSSLERKNFHLRWADFAAGGLECSTVPGNHLTIFREPDVEKLAGVLKAYLDRAHASEKEEYVSVVPI